VRRRLPDEEGGGCRIRRHRASPRRCSSPRGEGRAVGGGGGRRGSAGGRGRRGAARLSRRRGDEGGSAA
jgi:hypothetical protein